MLFRSAAGRIEAPRLRALDEAYRAGYQPKDAKSIARFLEAGKAFRVAIAQATGNAKLAAMVAQPLDQMTRLLHFALGLGNRAQEIGPEQRALVKALARGDREGAERAARDEIEAARALVLSAIMTSHTVMNLALGGERG